MLNVRCPGCSANMKLSTPKVGNFSPTCKECKLRFKLSIRQLPNGSFKHKASLKPVDKAADDVNSQAETQGANPQPAPSDATTADGLKTHRRLGPYRLIKKIGEGGMGTVFLANQTSLARIVALKVIKQRLSSNPSVMARFTREAYAAAQWSLLMGNRYDNWWPTKSRSIRS